MIEMQARAVVEAATVLAGWIEQILSGAVDVPPQLALQLRRTHRAFDEVTRDLMEQEDAILRRHGALEDERGFVPRSLDGKEDLGTFIIEDPAGLRTANRARVELFMTELDVAIEPLALDDVLSAGLTLDGRQAFRLAALFEDHNPRGER